MSDIVERLLAQGNGNYTNGTMSPVVMDMVDAANVITTLRVDLQKLKERNAEYIGTIDRLRRRVAETDVEIERLNRELDDVWDALAIQREDNVSFGDAFKQMTSEIERLQAALDVVRASGLLIGSTTLHDKVRAVVHAALAEEKKG